MTEPSCTSVQLAEMVLSDCGHSSNYVPLLERVAARIDAHVERCLESKKTTQQEAQEPVAWLDPWTGANVTTDYDAYGKHGIPLYTAPQPVEREPLTRAQAKALVLKYGNDPLHLVLQVERAHDIKGGQHGAE